MGCVDSKFKIPKESPLSLVLKHWKTLAGSETPLKKEELCRLSLNAWPLFGQMRGIAWPKFGPFELDTVFRLISLLHVEQRWQEIRYAELFLFLLTRPELGIGDKENESSGKMEKAEMVLGRGKRKDRVKAAPIPQILFKNTGEDDLDMLISPDRRESSPGAPQIGLPAAAAVGGAGAAGAVVAPPGPAPAGQAGAVGGLPGAGMAAPGGVGISGGVGSGAAGAAPGTISTGLAAMATSTGAGTVGVTGLGPSPAAAAATGAGATAAVAGGAGAVPTGGASVLTDLGGGAGAAPFPTPPPPEGEASILGGGGRKEEPREFPISASHEKGTETHRQGKPIPAAERREKRGLPPFDKDTEAEGSTLQKLQKVIELSRPIGLDTPAHPFQPGDWVYVKWWNSDPLRARWRGPYQVLLTSLTSVKVAGREPWFHYSRVKRASAPGTTNQTEPDTDDEDVE
ncbi:uncharacterized protein LOC127482264 isoform X2 [Manacus candei]|uniref:uncharacterized protein LOC127482264 isoform X2 n=1 Tax=Manacus candei TaxID=415023 RepID=UPI002227F389|nr:uncharacterized protein LOC127482264 isoform X2 [Manacus candei]